MSAPIVISAPSEVLNALRAAEVFVEAELMVRHDSYDCPPGQMSADETADIAEAEETLVLIRAAIAKIESAIAKAEGRI